MVSHPFVWIWLTQSVAFRAGSARCRKHNIQVCSRYIHGRRPSDWRSICCSSCCIYHFSASFRCFCGPSVFIPGVAYRVYLLDHPRSPCSPCLSGASEHRWPGLLYLECRCDNTIVSMDANLGVLARNINGTSPTATRTITRNKWLRSSLKSLWWCSSLFR